MIFFYLREIPLDNMRISTTIAILCVFVELVGAEKDGSTAVHWEKIIIFSSFSSFVIGLIILHCCLKHRKLRKEKRRRACLDCEEAMPKRLQCSVERTERCRPVEKVENIEYGNFVII